MRFRQLAAVTALFVGLTMLVGMFTATAGAGLTCQQQWPLCDGPLGGLLPADYQSAIELGHRVIAGFTGLPVLATAILSWRTDQSTRIRYASTAIVLLLPIQVFLGRATVKSYTAASLFSHLLLPTLLFTLAVFTAVWAYTPDASDRRQTAARLATVVSLVAIVFSPRLFIIPPSQFLNGVVTVAYNGLLLTGVAGFIATAVWADTDRTAQFATLGSVLSVALIVLGRQTYGRPVVLATPLLLVALAACGYLAARGTAGTRLSASLSK